jgi:hypothetical protein
MSDSIKKMIKEIKQMEKNGYSVHEIYAYHVYQERIKYNLKRFNNE